MAELSYPNISFQETVIGPAPTRRPWRDRIGVVGEFSKGPTFPVRISSREDFVKNFGDDNTEASLQVQDAQILGASNFTICRAVPDSAAAKGSIIIAGGNLNIEPIVGFSNNPNNSNSVPVTVGRHVGIEFTASYIGSPTLIAPTFGPIDTTGTFDGAKVTGRANLRLHVIDCVDAGPTADPLHAGGTSISLNCTTSLAGVYQYITISKTDGVGNNINLIAPFIRPGYTLRTSNAVEGMLILSPVLNHSPTHWGLVVKNLSDITAVSNVLAAVEVYNPSAAHYIIGYATELVDSSVVNTVVPYFSLNGQSTTVGGISYSIDNYFELPVSAVSNDFINFQFHTAPATVTSTLTTVLTPDSFAETVANFKVRYGTAGATARNLLKGGAVSIPFAYESIIVGGATSSATGAYTSGTPSSQVVNDLAQAIQTNSTFSSLLGAVEPQVIVPPYKINLETRLAGTEANRVVITTEDKFAGSVTTDPTDFETTVEAITGGFSGPSFALRDFYALNNVPLLRVVATSPGSYGNQLQITIIPETVQGDSASYEIVVTDINTSAVETERWRLTNTEINEEGLYLSTVGSKLIRAYFLPRVYTGSAAPVSAPTYKLQPLRSAPALSLQAAAFNSGATAVGAQAGSFIREVNLAGAFDYRPSTITQLEARKRGYIAALEQMKSEDVAYLLLPGLTYGNTSYQEVFEAAVTQVSNAKPENGLRQALFDAPVGISPNQVAPLTARINNERVRLVVGHSTSRSFSGKVYPQVGSSGKMAGLLAVRAPQISAASTFGGFLLDNVLSVDTKNDPNYLNTVTLAHADVLYFDSGIGGFKFLNGVTTSYNPSRRYGSVRAIMDQLISDLYVSLQWVRSEPNTRELQRRVSASVDARLQQGLRNGSLIRVFPCICGRENNSESDMIAGNLNISIRVTPVFPADFIKVNVVRDLSENLSLQTASGVSAF
jgi:hypothetical protein